MMGFRKWLAWRLVHAVHRLLHVPPDDELAEIDTTPEQFEEYMRAGWPAILIDPSARTTFNDCNFRRYG